MMVADEDIPVLLQGETGSGKDVFARAIHAASDRAGGHYVALNCAAMPESLIDAELFGYEPGAFTGARRDGSKGLIVQADGGTLFLDEIGDMPLALQTRLLRVLENREVWPLGALKPLPVDIRLISATHRDLDAMVADRGFRADLYYRLRGLQVELPPLRARRDKADVIAQIATEEAPRARLSSGALDMLLAHPFPGQHAAIAPCAAACRLYRRGRPHRRGRSRFAAGRRPSDAARFRNRGAQRHRRSLAPTWRPRHGRGAFAEGQPRHALPQDQGVGDRTRRGTQEKLLQLSLRALMSPSAMASRIACTPWNAPRR